MLPSGAIFYFAVLSNYPEMLALETAIANLY